MFSFNLSNTVNSISSTLANTANSVISIGNGAISTVQTIDMSAITVDMSGVNSAINSAYNTMVEAVVSVGQPITLDSLNPLNLLPSGMFIITPELVTALLAELFTCTFLAINIFGGASIIVIGLLALIAAWNALVICTELYYGAYYFAYAVEE